MTRLEDNLRLIFDHALTDIFRVSERNKALLSHDGRDMRVLQDVPLKWFDETTCSACYSFCYVYEFPDGTFKVLVDNGHVVCQGGPYEAYFTEVECRNILEVFKVLYGERQYDGNFTTDAINEIINEIGHPAAKEYAWWRNYRYQDLFDRKDFDGKSIMDVISDMEPEQITKIVRKDLEQTAGAHSEDEEEVD